MRQVPRYLIIGNGRLARHFRHYFSMLSLAFDSWDRSQPQETLISHLAQATHVLVLISDNAINRFYQHHLKTYKGFIIHCSGSLIHEEIIGAHPLMTFNDNLYSLNEYEKIPFIVDDHAPEFSLLFPGLPNQHARLDLAKKSKYHALCVMAGNFSCLLWQKLFSSLADECGIPSSFAHAYLQKQTDNLIDDSKRALTGPLVRGDQVTIDKNIAALEHDPFQRVYQSFIDCYALTKRGVSHEYS